jgi:rubrerythrin
MSQQSDMIGDKSQFENRGMDEQLFQIYICPICKYDCDIPITYEPSIGGFLPIDLSETLCPHCDEVYMEKS